MIASLPIFAFVAISLACMVPSLRNRLRTEPTVADERDLEGNAADLTRMGARAR